MLRLICSCWMLLTLATVSRADFYFVIPGSEQGSPLRLVFNHQPRVNSMRGVTADLRLKSPDGSAVPAVVGGPGWLVIEPAKSGPTSLIIEHGVVLRGQRDPVRVIFYPKHQTTLSSEASSVSTMALELEAVRSGNGLAFVVRANGQPLAAADVLVYVPGEKRVRVARTDSLGITPSFTTEGLYGARVYHKELKAGELQGRPYQEVRHYATLTVNFSAAP